MSVGGVTWWALNLCRMFQSDLRAKSTAQQRAPTEATKIARSAAHGREGMARFPTLLCRKDGPEQPSEVQAFRLIENCAALAFGMDARHVANNFQFQPAVPERLRRDLPV